MQLEHLVAVNDPSNDLVLTRAELWKGLLIRAECPDVFMPHVDHVEIIERSSLHLLRKMIIGAMHIQDRIHLVHEQHLRYDTEPSEQHGGGTLLMQIEEPETGMLFVRFHYQTPQDDQGEEEEYAKFLKAAWQQNDVETIKKIRELAAEGSLAIKS
ncbi:MULTISPECIES: AtaL-like protein [unclassified Iodobacter]|uniref:AtaL-like protein n=1 Tax=unclassified Iodobacter TaxID=235634 RepID=UPI0025F9CA52|nr:MULTISPECIES: AtaL-like protein [unclassified Iodobacter]MDW5417034.1 AtaL-like protein [Iodobacter sp. CM08]